MKYNTLYINIRRTSQTLFYAIGGLGGSNGFYEVDYIETSY